MFFVFDEDGMQGMEEDVGAHNDGMVGSLL